jgi:hypothetical protein
MDLNPRYWPGFPYAELTGSFDVFLPMGYFTYRFRTPAPTAEYTHENVRLLRERSGDDSLPIHLVGGLARAATIAQVRAFAEATKAEGVAGASLYDFADTRPAQWRALIGASRPGSG